MQMSSKYAEVADFLIIYIAEAHPTNGWAIPGNIEVADAK